MLFSSFKFLFVFLPVVAVAYYLCARRVSARMAQIVLIAASFLFYAFARPAHAPLLLGSIIANYLFACGIARIEGERRKTLLVAGLTFNVLFLASFKYLNLVLRHFLLLAVLGLHLPDWAFPLGISFFTLQQIMYLVDVYEKLVPANDLISHAAFVSFFATVTSGPLTRARQMVPQFKQVVTAHAPGVTQGITLLAIGLFKKVVFADSFSRISDAGFSHAGALSALEAWVVSFSYTFQIYFDFSGYSDMAIGTALLMGFSVPINFNTPYRSLSIIEFWQRWHITLSQFITTYLYTPIIRSFRKATLTAGVTSTLAAMTIVGIWHGPSLTFLLFGFLHGVALAANLIWRKRIKIALPKALSWGLTMLFVNLAFIFFRSGNIAVALDVCHALVSPHGALSTGALRESIRFSEVQVIFLPVLVGVPAAMIGRNSNELAYQPNSSLRMGLAVTAMLLLAFLFMNSTVAKEFVYFAF
jgi:alginate O-acetyltransferase complex protein AlgI